MSSGFNYDLSKLQGRVVEICGTQGVFASRMGWSERTVSLKMGGKTDWKRNDVLKAANILNITVEEIPAYFFFCGVQTIEQN